jgi:hypothetical protein
MSNTRPAERPGFQQQQLAFAAHIRDPDNSPAPADVEDRRMAIYRELFYNNVEGFLSSGFPVLRAISSDEVWHRRVRRFFAGYRCQTPFFAEISREFMAWLASDSGSHPDDPPFAAELAHYEWVELALQISDADRQLPALDHNGDVFAAVPVISPVAWHLAYRYPVHRIGPEFLPEAPGEQPTYLIVYRDRQDQIHFLEINAVTYRLLELLKDYPDGTGLDAVKRIAAELQHPQPESVMAHGRVLLEDLRQRNIIIGTRK